LALGLIASYILIFIFNFSIIDMPGYVFSQQNTVNDRNNWHMTM
jgi:GTP-binding protein EngB required for normal cell division